MGDFIPTRSLGVPGGSNNKESACQGRQSGVQSLSWEHSQEKEMATYFSILAWKIPWTEEPGRPPSRGLQSQTGWNS